MLPAVLAWVVKLPSPVASVLVYMKNNIGMQKRFEDKMRLSRMNMVCDNNFETLQNNT